MVPVLKSELKKLLSVRSTYLIAFLVIALSGLVTYASTQGTYTGGDCAAPKTIETKTADGKTKVETVFEDCPPPRLSPDLPKEQLRQNITNAISGLSILVAVAVILLMAHEYRYNTITYTLTLAKSRSRVLAGKILIGAACAVILATLAIAVITAATYIAVAVKDLNLPPQDIEWLATGGRMLFYVLGFSMLGLALITLIRNLTAGIVALFILPGIDGLFSQLFYNREIDPAKYLPFSALERLIRPPIAGMGEGGPIDATDNPLLHNQSSAGRAMLVFLIYLVTTWLISWYLFLRRDAT